MSKNILLTFDYELFLGSSSGSVLNCMIIPTNEILGILKKHKSKAIFFVDTTYLYQLEKIAKDFPEARQDYRLILDQLKEIVSQGHYIFHHLHPHWLDAEYIPEINQWNLKNSSRFSLYSIDEKEKDKLFSFSTILLRGIYENLNLEVKPDGFRAGGLFIEPFSCFKTYFEKYGIKYEFSVVPGEVKHGAKLFYDFSSLTKYQPYRFTDNLNLEKIDGSFYEFPISKIKIKGFYKLLNSIYYRLNKKTNNFLPYGDGASVSSSINSNNTKKTIRDYLIFEIALSVEMLNPVLLPIYKRKIEHDKFIHFLSHPKLLTKTSIQELDKLLTFSNINFSVEYDFKKMTN
jgi:hypothetical protein